MFLKPSDNTLLLLLMHKSLAIFAALLATCTLLLPLVQCCLALLEVLECPFSHVIQLCQEAQSHHHPLALPECTSLICCECNHE